MIRSWWDQLLIIYIPSLNVPFITLEIDSKNVRERFQKFGEMTHEMW